MIMEKLFTVREVADLLHISIVAVYSWIHGGMLPAIRIGKEWRVKERDLEEFLDSRQNKSTE